MATARHVRRRKQETQITAHLEVQKDERCGCSTGVRGESRTSQAGIPSPPLGLLPPLAAGQLHGWGDRAPAMAARAELSASAQQGKDPSPTAGPPRTTGGWVGRGPRSARSRSLLSAWCSQWHRRTETRAHTIDSDAVWFGHISWKMTDEEVYKRLS